MTRSLLLALALVGCDPSSTPAGEPTTTPSTARGARQRAVKKPPVEFVPAAAAQEPLSTLVPREQARADRDGRQLLLYVGASWCEPCRRFHDAAAAGELDDEFPGLRLLAFDRDRDEARLGEADCLTRLIPLFAKPTPEGRCGKARIMGSIKGPGAVAQITPRLKRVLDTP